MFNRSEHMRKLWLKAYLYMKAGLPKPNKLRPKKQYKFIFPELHKDETNE